MMVLGGIFVKPHEYHLYWTWISANLSPVPPLPTPATSPNRSQYCLHAPPPSFPTSFPLYPFFPFPFSVVLSSTFRQSLHLLLCRWCSQRALPPQSLHVPLCRWCSQRLLPPPLHSLFRRWCSQNLLPPQSLQSLLTQKELLLQSLRHMYTYI